MPYHVFGEIKCGDIRLFEFTMQQSCEIAGATADIKNATGINFGKLKMLQQPVGHLALQNSMLIISFGSRRKCPFHL